MNNLIDAAAKDALKHPLAMQQQRVTFPVQDVLGMVSLRLITNRQAFDWIFKGKPPEEFLCKEDCGAADGT